MKKTTISVFAVMAMLLFSLLTVPVTIADSGYGPFPVGQTRNLDIYYPAAQETKTWYHWDNNNDDLAIVLYGGMPYSNYVENSPFYGNDNNPYHENYEDEKALIDGLVSYGLDVISPAYVFHYYFNSPSGRGWLSYAADYVRGEYEYDNVYLFGHSAGGVVAAYEIQQEGADQVYDAAVIASAPVDCADYLFTDHFYNTADTAEDAEVRACFICNEQDEAFAHHVDLAYGGGWILDPWWLPTAYDHLWTYYNNMPEGLDTAWHKWGQADEYQRPLYPYECHDIFPDTCLDCGQGLAEVVYEWFTGSSHLTIQGWYGGYTNPPAGGYDYSVGTNVEVEAIAIPNWDFDHWERDGQPYSTDNPVTITMDHDYILKPIFAPPPPPSHQLSVVAINQFGQHAGVPLTINGDPAGNTPYTETIQEGYYTLEVPDNFYGSFFYGWLYNGQLYSNPITINLDSDKSLAACYLTPY